MSKVEIRKTGNSWHVSVDDGPNLAAAMAAAGLRIDVPPWPDPPLVHITLLAHELNVHLDDATVAAAEALLPEGFRK